MSMPMSWVLGVILFLEKKAGGDSALLVLQLSAEPQISIPGNK